MVKIERINAERTQNEKTNEIEAGDNSVLANTTTDQRPFQRKRRRQLFCPDVIYESVQFLRLLDLLQVSTINRRTLGGLCRRALYRLKPPRIVGRLRIVDTSEVVYREPWQTVPFPKVPPPLDNILGFGGVKIDLHHSFLLRNAQILKRIGEFLRLSEELLGQHNLLLKIIRCFKKAAEVLDERILSQLTRGVRLIEMDLNRNGIPVTLLKSQTFRGNNRLLIHHHSFGHTSKRQFQDCADWLHSPIADGVSRTLIVALGDDLSGIKDTFLPMVVKRFERNERNNNGEPPKFCLILLIDDEEPETELLPFHLTNEKRGDALSLELIRHGRDRFGRPLSELFSIDPRIESLDESGILAIENFLRHMFNLHHYMHLSTPISTTMNIYILRRDVAVGPWIRPELFMACWPVNVSPWPDPVPEHNKLLHISLVQ